MKKLVTAFFLVCGILVFSPTEAQAQDEGFCGVACSTCQIPINGGPTLTGSQGTDPRGFGNLDPSCVGANDCATCTGPAMAEEAFGNSHDIAQALAVLDASEMDEFVMAFGDRIMFDPGQRVVGIFGATCSAKGVGISRIVVVGVEKARALERLDIRSLSAELMLEAQT